jgi:hypothetical protein
MPVSGGKSLRPVWEFKEMMMRGVAVAREGDKITEHVTRA